MILIDTDVLLDVALRRQAFFRDSADLLLSAHEGQIELGVTPVILSNLYYLIRANADEKKANQFLTNTLALCSFLSHEKPDFQKALSSEFRDKEDAINYFTALRNNATMIVSRNIKDFRHSNIPIKTPKELLLSI